MRDFRRSRFFCIVALAVALAVVGMPSARGATASEVLVDKSFHITLLRTVDGTLAFPDATGTTSESATPVGKYKVTEKQADPNWYWEGKVYAPYLRDKTNGLGVRWIGMSLPSYGLHGTNDPFSIGKDVSHGCVRHQNADVTKAFSMIPTGTPVRIIETPIPQRTEEMVTDFLELYDLLTVMEGSH